MESIRDADAITNISSVLVYATKRFQNCVVTLWMSMRETLLLGTKLSKWIAIKVSRSN